MPTSTPDASVSHSVDWGSAKEADGREEIARAIEHAAHLLPTQGPLSIFVHHNTLHALEALPFEEAVVEGKRLFGCEPYLSEQRYHEELTRGRITREDLREVLMDDLQDDADILVASFGTRYTLRLSMLQTLLPPIPDAELHWMLAETQLLRSFRNDVPAAFRERVLTQTRAWVTRQWAIECSDEVESRTSKHHASPLPQVVRSELAADKSKPIHRWSDEQWERFTLRCLWKLCECGVHIADETTSQKEDALPRVDVPIAESIGRVCGENPNALVDQVLIRFCASYLDQGFADWMLPDRQHGFACAFSLLLEGSWNLRPTWMASIKEDLKQVCHSSWDALDSIECSLSRLGLEGQDRESFLTHSLLALRGWAGMVWQAEKQGKAFKQSVSSGTLSEYLAIRLLLFRGAVESIGQQHFGNSQLLASDIVQRVRKQAGSQTNLGTGSRVHTVFQLAQLGGWTPEQLTNMSPAQWRCLVGEVDSFSSIHRRRLLHLAYERQYRQSALDAIAVHAQRRREKQATPVETKYAAIFCIDDREESFRRHLEEVQPMCRTAAAAGFFGVAMNYRGTDHARFRPLCPAIVTPKHYVREEPLFSAIDVSERRAIRRRRIGRFNHQVHQHSRTMLGGWVTGVLGAVATFPMVARILAPRLTSRVRDSAGIFVSPPATELHLERLAEDPGPEPDAMGYSLDEMAAIVVRVLQDIGIVREFPPIILFFGHGSGSLNNPHESAYNCGACSGGRGGPNARAFAMMANDARVRRRMRALGIDLPDDLRVLGAYHNTCNDAVQYYDLDWLPRSHRDLFREIERDIEETRARNAHERARRFESASLDLTPREALKHVEERAEDLSQARPEYNHATNALVTVGRREWTRGLFMDRRVFLTEYDPALDDDDNSILSRILQAAIPVCAGISLEYYFSTVDVEGYGCGSKLPHNVVSMIGVMTGASSDLRPGLSQQMVEIHEPMRILFVIETTPERLSRIIQANEAIRRLVQGDWVQVAVIDPETAVISRYVKGRFEPHLIAEHELPRAPSSSHWYRGRRGHLGFASIDESAPQEAVR
ncbi:DUF2309 domain-containing protein [Rhodopirellula halodulae]|uniref:DUF2309 domain-containing protein n=1 Tax=Rhodopirellula halodulae TaxID=2894198 RepID=UPI001E3C0443|nr:DUF2309 domain-containing protein [Rhodopirellula sp. JC737]MCC9654387.1 DUF2309 domain-containing protein [Rhodopirellula sp. JC737]